MSRTRHTPDRLKVRWEWAEKRKTLWAMRGERIIGHVVLGSPEAYGPGPTWIYSLEAVHWKWITKGHGQCKTRAQACRSLERAWHDWLEAMEIIDAGTDPGLAVSGAHPEAGANGQGAGAA